MTMTMTHSDEVINGSQNPGPTDVTAGVMTPHKKNLRSVYVVAQQARKTLGALCEIVRRVTCQQAYAVANSSEFKEVATLTHVSYRRKRCKTRTRLLKCGRLLHLCGLRPSALEGFHSLRDQGHCSENLCSHVLACKRGTTSNACKPYQSKAVWSLVSGYAMISTS